MQIIGISGSLRNNSLNTWLLNAAAELMPVGVDFKIVKIDQVPLYNEDSDGEDKPIAVRELLTRIHKAGAVLFASPEYNHGISGVLKNAIDWASRPAFQSVLLNKPCGILTASKSPVGGARAQADLKNVLSSTLSFVYPTVEYLLPNAHEKFDAQGQLIDDTAQRRLQRYVEGLIVWADRKAHF